MIDTPLGIFEDGYEYAHALNKLRLDAYGNEKFTNVMILPTEPIFYGVVPDRYYLPKIPEWRLIF